MLRLVMGRGRFRTANAMLMTKNDLFLHLFSEKLPF